MNTKYIDRPFQDFFEDLSSDKSSPGGGSVGALVGVQSASLIMMVGHLTVGKKKYSGVEPAVKEILSKAGQCKSFFMNKIDEDIEVFQEVMAAYKIPKESRKVPLEKALKKSALFSFSMVEKGLELLKLAQEITEKGNSNLISDSAIALKLGLACIELSIINVRINLQSIQKSDFAIDLEKKITGILIEGNLIVKDGLKLVNQYIQVG